MVVVTCKGRLRHLRWTLPSLLAATDFPVCVVDFACPDRSGDWAKACGGARILVERVDARVAGPYFHKSRAQNLGAAAAIRHGASRLLFLDADTLVRAKVPSGWQETQRGSCLVAPRDGGGRSIPSLSGVLLVHVEDFRQAGGFDEGFAGWGSEDIDLRLRLYLVGCTFNTTPNGMFAAVPHSSLLRTKYYAEKNLRRGAAINERRMLERLRGATGRDLAEEPEALRQLLF